MKQSFIKSIKLKSFWIWISWVVAVFLFLIIGLILIKLNIHGPSIVVTIAGAFLCIPMNIAHMEYLNELYKS